MAEDTLYPEAKPAETSAINPLAKDFLKVYQDYQNTYSDKLQEKRNLEDLEDGIANTDDPKISNKRTNTSLPHKVLYNILKQLDIPTIKMKSGSMTEAELAITQSLFEDGLEKCNWRKVLTDRKNGAYKEYMGTGDSIIGFGTSQDKFPFSFWNVDFNRTGVNTEANQMFNPGSEKEVRKLTTIKEYQNSQLFSMFPELDGKVTIGALPTVGADGSVDTNQTEEQKVVTKLKRTQYAYAYDLDYQAEDGERGLYQTFAGKNLFVHKELSGKNYPWRDRDGNPTKPFGHLVCFTRSKGFVNYGILQIVYKLGDMHRTLTNMGITYALSNSNPVRIVATSQSEGEFAGNFTRAQQRGKDGKVPIMVNRDGKEFGGVSTLQSNPIINELNATLELMEKDLAQMGFNVNDTVTSGAKTLGALQLEVAASTALIIYIQKENSDAKERLLQMFVDSLRESKKDYSDITLSSNIQVRDAEGNLQELGGMPEIDETGEIVKVGNKIKAARPWTLQDLKEMFIKHEDIDIEVKGGVQNNPVLEDNVLQSLINSSDPTSKAAAMFRGARARNLGHNVRDEDFSPGSGMPQQAAPAGAATPPTPADNFAQQL